MIEFKYQQEIDELECACPPSKFSEANRKSYRWVHEDFGHPNNFLPVVKIEPNRLEELNPCSQKCSGYGLSLFTDLSKAESKLKTLLDRKPNLVDVFGNCIAEGQVEESDGVLDTPRKDGHFTIHEYKNCNLTTKFKTIKKV